MMKMLGGLLMPCFQLISSLSICDEEMRSERVNIHILN